MAVAPILTIYLETFLDMRANENARPLAPCRPVKELEVAFLELGNLIDC